MRNLKLISCVFFYLSIFQTPDSIYDRHPYKIHSTEIRLFQVYKLYLEQTSYLRLMISKTTTTQDKNDKLNKTQKSIDSKLLRHAL